MQKNSGSCCLYWTTIFLCATSITYQGIFYTIMGAKIHNTATISDTLLNYTPDSGNKFGEKSIIKFLDLIEKNNLLIIEKPENWLLIGAIITILYLVYYVIDAMNQNKKLIERIDEYHIEDMQDHSAIMKMTTLYHDGETNGEAQKKSQEDI